MALICCNNWWNKFRLWNEEKTSYLLDEMSSPGVPLCFEMSLMAGSHRIVLLGLRCWSNLKEQPALISPSGTSKTPSNSGSQIPVAFSLMALRPGQALVPYASTGVSEGVRKHFEWSIGCTNFQAAARARELQFTAAPLPPSQITSFAPCMRVCLGFAH